MATIKPLASASQIDSAVDAMSAQMAPLYADALAAEVRGHPEPELWREATATLTRSLILAALLGHAREMRRIRAGGGVEATEPEPPIRSLDEIGMFAGETRSPLVVSEELVQMPFLDALNAFRDDVPGLAGIARAGLAEAQMVAGSIVNEQRNAGREAVAKAIAEAVSTAPGDAEGLIRGFTREGVARAIQSAAGVRRISSSMETQARTALMYSFNSGARDLLQRHPDAIPIFLLTELSDRRVRGNPRGLYPDAGPHWLFREFAAPANDPIWNRIWPPNGWNCRATARGVSSAEARRRGWLLEDGRPDAAGMKNAYGRQWAALDAGDYPDPGFQTRIPSAA